MRRSSSGSTLDAMNRPPFEVDVELAKRTGQPAPDAWLIRNDEVIGLGLDWLRRRLAEQIAWQRSAGPPVEFTTDGAAIMSDLRADWLLRDARPGLVDASEES